VGSQSTRLRAAISAISAFVVSASWASPARLVGAEEVARLGNRVGGETQVGVVGGVHEQHAGGAAPRRLLELGAFGPWARISPFSIRTETLRLPRSPRTSG
jgi:hypothetical protein